MATSLKLDADLKTRVQRLAASRHRSPHWLMCNAIRQYVEHEEKQARFIEEALAAWHHYQETGLHLTGEEVQQWLSTWGSEDEQEQPPCHK